jgi:hypothetical protein
MSRTKLLAAAVAMAALLAWMAAQALAADDSRVKAATHEVESGAKKIGDGKVGPGVEETAKGVGHTVVEGAKYSGDKLKESGKAAEPQAKSAWQSVKDGATSFGGSVKHFFTRLFSSS